MKNTIIKIRPEIVTQRFFVPGPLPSLNEIIAACKGYNGRGFAYSKMKEEWTGLVVTCIQEAQLQPMNSCRVVCEWREKSKRRDLDNVRVGVKFILDGLVKAGILPNDTQQYVWQISDSLTLDKENPGVQVELYS